MFISTLIVNSKFVGLNTKMMGNSIVFIQAVTYVCNAVSLSLFVYNQFVAVLADMWNKVKLKQVWRCLQSDRRQDIPFPKTDIIDATNRRELK